MSSESNPTLPLEIVETVIDVLARDDPSYSSLKLCSLTCHTFLHLCRKHIFATILLDDHKQFDSRPTTAAFARLLSTTPKISDYIRKIHCYISSEAFDNPALPVILKQINKLESLSLHWPGSHRQWGDNPLRSAVLHLLHQPNLIYLWLQDITDFVVSDLMSCSNLKDLDFSKIEAVELDNPVPSNMACRQVCLQRFSAWGRSSTTILKLCRFLGPSGKTIFDFSSISCISFFLYYREELEATREFVKHCEKLRDIFIFSRSPVTWTGLAKMLHPSIQTLVELHLNPTIDNTDGTNDPLSGLVAELKEMRHQNRIEIITINVSTAVDADCNRGDDWGYLDAELTRSGWPKLRSVSLHIKIYSNLRQSNELELALKELPKTQFPRLSSSKSVVFEFSVVSESI